jgi:UPF0176 protein
MSIVNVSTYKFVKLDNLVDVKELFVSQCSAIDLLGTILISHEGLNIMLAGTQEKIDAFSLFLKSDPRFCDIEFKVSYSDSVPFERMRIRIKPEIISMGVDSAQPLDGLGQHIKPSDLKQWLDDKKDFTLLDTRNGYELDFGGFDEAVDPVIDTFREFPAAVDALDASLKEKPLVMFCTGGVRCEKASLLMEEKGFKDVYQLEGGILKYFEECGGAHWHGDCFVFDERIALTPELKETGATQCRVCNAPVTAEETQLESYKPQISCPYCINGQSQGRVRRCNQSENNQTVN